MKWIALIVVIALGVLVLAFMTPDEASGNLLNFASLGQAFDGGSLGERIASLTPGRVITVTGNTASHLAGKTLGVVTTGLGGIVDTARTRGGETQEQAVETATHFIPQTAEEKRTELIQRLDARVEALEKTESEAELEELKKELSVLVEQLREVQEDGGLFSKVYDTSKNLVSGNTEEEECACSVPAQ